MKTVKIAELKNRLSHYLRAAEHGDEVIVTDRNRPIVRIVGLAGAESALQLTPPTRALGDLQKRSWPAAHWPRPSGAILDEERAER